MLGMGDPQKWEGECPVCSPADGGPEGWRRVLEGILETGGGGRSVSLVLG